METIEINDEILKTIYRAIKTAVAYEKLTGRKLGITGEVGEVLVCRRLGLKLAADPLFAGCDATDDMGKCYQIKTRRVDHARGRTGIFSKHLFDQAILAILDTGYKIAELYSADFDKINPFIDQAPRRNPSLRQFKAVADKIL